MSVLMYHGQAITGIQGPQGPDGNPIGTVISYMGIAAPKDYLICDGAIYNIADYSDLAKHIQTNFGLTNFFGGDGTTTFAVPDMRNLFLRGYHGEAEEQLSGDVGVKQEGTNHLNVQYKYSYINVPRPENDQSDIKTVINQDKFIGTERTRDIVYTLDPNQSTHQYYTARPVNMAVLYCIKAKLMPTDSQYIETKVSKYGDTMTGKFTIEKEKKNGVTRLGSIISFNYYGNDEITTLDFRSNDLSTDTLWLFSDSSMDGNGVYLTADTPKNKGDGYSRIRGLNYYPQNEDEAAAKGYVDRLIGNISTLLDKINGEVV